MSVSPLNADSSSGLSIMLISPTHSPSVSTAKRYSNDKPTSSTAVSIEDLNNIGRGRPSDSTIESEGIRRTLTLNASLILTPVSHKLQKSQTYV